MIDISYEALIRCWRKIADPENGWLRHEFRDGLVWKTLLVMTSKGETLSAAATADRGRWLKKLASEAWAERYGGGWSQVKALLERSNKAAQEQEKERRREAEERVKRAEEIAAQKERLREEQRRRADDAIASQRQQRRWTMAAVGTAVVAIIAAAYAWTQSERADQAALDAQKAQAQAEEQRDAARHAKAKAEEQRLRAEQAVIETKAASYWSGLQLWSDPLTFRDVATLWDLTQQDDTVRVAFVRQLASNPGLIAQFGFKPQPIARAVGLRWPDEAREIVKQSVAELASGQFDLKKPIHGSLSPTLGFWLLLRSCWSWIRRR